MVVLVTRLTTVLFVFMCLALSACGGGEESGTSGAGDGSKRFEGDGFSFSYPDDWSLGEFAEPNPELATAVALSYGGAEQGTTDSVAVSVAPALSPITEDNLEGSLDDFAAFAADSYGELLSAPTPTTVDGLPAVRLKASGPSPDGVPLEFGTTIVLDGTTWYVIQSQFVPKNADKIKPGYDQSVGSFQVE